MGERVRVSSFDDVKDAFRQRELRQALYDDGESLMKHVIVNLHADEHRTRRRVENRLFRRDVFHLYEHELIPAAVNELLEPHLRDGWVELQALTRRTMLHVGLLVAGIDRPAGTTEESTRLAALLVRLSRASVVAQSTLPKQDVIDDGQVALAELQREFITPSAERRQELVAAHERGELAEGDLPRDVPHHVAALPERARPDLGADRQGGRLLPVGVLAQHRERTLPHDGRAVRMAGASPRGPGARG